MMNTLWLEQKVQQIDGHRKISMTNTWDLNKKYNKKLEEGKKYNKYLKVEQKVGQKLESSVKSINYTLKSPFKSHLPIEHPSQTPNSKPTFLMSHLGPWSCEKL